MLMLRHGKCSGLFNGRVPLFWINPSIFPRNMLRDYAPTEHFLRSVPRFAKRDSLVLQNEILAGKHIAPTARGTGERENTHCLVESERR
jgi:hypothetical protein